MFLIPILNLACSFVQTYLLGHHKGRFHHVVGYHVGHLWVLEVDEFLLQLIWWLIWEQLLNRRIIVLLSGFLLHLE